MIIHDEQWGVISLSQLMVAAIMEKRLRYDTDMVSLSSLGETWRGVQRNNNNNQKLVVLIFWAQYFIIYWRRNQKHL